MKTPYISIITVCFNAIDVISMTERSLRTQTFSNYEWVVVDGNSSDGTSEWLRDSRPDVLLIEPDSGIYDAMNKAVNLSSGDWLFFLNAGDLFCDDEVLNDFFCNMENATESSDIGLLYGNVVYYGDSGNRRKKFDWVTPRRLVYGDLCHQAVFSRRCIYQKIGVFDASLRFNADFDWFLRAFRSGVIGKYQDRDIALFHDNGTHVVNSGVSEIERRVVRLRFVSWLNWLIGHSILRIYFKIRKLLE